MPEPIRTYVPERLPLGNIDWIRLISPIGEARATIARYEGMLHAVPNPELLLSPLTTQEAVLSSSIEGSTATLTDVYQFDAGIADQLDEAKRIDILEVRNYRRALRLATEALANRPFNLNLLLDMHATLMDSVRGDNKSPGRFRTAQNWIGPAGSTIENAYFVPPSPETIQGHLTNWETYYHADEKDPLVQLAILHAQFEIIHPFLDGNGRLGRILVPLFIYEKELLPTPTFYLSEYFEENRDEYSQYLRDIHGTDGWTEWIEFFLGAVIHQAETNTAKALLIKSLYEKVKSEAITSIRSHYAIPIIDYLFTKPIVRNQDIITIGGMPSLPTVNNILNALKQKGVLKVIQEPSGQKPQVFAFAELINICEGKTVF